MTSFRDSWFHPGDTRRLDDDGRLVIEGRVDEMTNLGGDKVMPGVVEEAVRAEAGIWDAAATMDAKNWIVQLGTEDFMLEKHPLRSRHLVTRSAQRLQIRPVSGTRP